MKIAATALLAALGATAPALAASSAWEQAQGAAVRIVVSDRAEPDGRLRAALEIDLKPGWKTYWVDPGSSGVPPSVELAAGGTAGAAEMRLPAPRRLGDGYSSFAGYDRPVSFALLVTPPDGWKEGALDFSIFLGICETICIPVQATLSVDLAAPSGDNAGDEAGVDAAFSRLPAAPRDGFAVSSAWVDGDELVVETQSPDPAGTELFVASTPSFTFGEPRRASDGRAFRVPLLDRPAAPAAPPEQAHYTIVAGDEAVSGTFPVSGHP